MLAQPSLRKPLFPFFRSTSLSGLVLLTPHSWGQSLLPSPATVPGRRSGHCSGLAAKLPSHPPPPAPHTPHVLGQATPSPGRLGVSCHNRCLREHPPRSYRGRLLLIVNLCPSGK